MKSKSKKKKKAALNLMIVGFDPDIAGSPTEAAKNLEVTEDTPVP